MDAIYVHGLGSGAATSTIDQVRKHFPQFVWHAVEVNEDPEESVRVINEAIRQYDTRCVLGTSLGGLYLMYADTRTRRAPVTRIICNPACSIANDIREKIGFGTKRYFVPRQDGVQEYTLDESVCRRFEKFIGTHAMTAARQEDGNRDIAVFSIHDELIGEHGVLENMAKCFNAGFEIMIDDRGGHRLRKEVLDLIQSQVFIHMHYQENNIISKQ